MIQNYANLKQENIYKRISSYSPNWIQVRSVLFRLNRQVKYRVSFVHPFSFYLSLECNLVAVHDDKCIVHHLDIPKTIRISIFLQRPKSTCKSVLKEKKKPF